MKDCIFCKIINNEIPCYKLYEDDLFIAILDSFPCNIGHSLIITKKHYNNIFDLNKEEAQQVFLLTNKIASALKKSFNFEGINILQNNGATAGQTVMHFHIHLIPRYEDDKVIIKGDTYNITKQEFLKIQEKIKTNLEI